MRRYGWWLVVGALVVLNGVLLLRARKLDNALKAVTGDEAYLAIMDGDLVDARGVYTLPTLGKYFVPIEAIDANVPLNLVIFLSSKTSCPSNLMELDVYKRLVPLYSERGQMVSALCAPDDSIAVAYILDSADLPIVLSAFRSEQFTWSQMGISTEFMPFKVVFDSSYTAVYMRGGDNTPRSREEFEKAAARLSRLVWEGQL